MLSEDDIKRLFRVRKTLTKMLKDRNYLVLDSEINMTYEEFVDKYGHQMKREDITICKARKNDSSDQIYVFFPREAKLSFATFKSYFTKMEGDKVLRAIVVIQDSLSSFAQKNIISANATKFNIEIFQEAELLVNVTEHFLVPQHQVLTKEEKKTLLERYTLKETQLPRIQVTDPVARYYGMKRGQVAKIIRDSETAGRYITYRYVV